MYPKLMTAGPNQTVVVANEDQERALPIEYGGLAGAFVEPTAANKEELHVETAEAETEPKSEQEAKPDAEKPAALTKAELQAMLKEKGISYNGTWGVVNLQKALAAA